MNYQEIITTKVLIDEYNIESDAPLVEDAKRCGLKYKEIRNNGKRNNVEFIVEQIVIPDIVPIEDWETYNNNINKFIDKEVQYRLQTDLTDVKKDIFAIASSSIDYKNPYNIAGSVGSCLISNNSKYSKYLRKIEINKFKVNNYCHFVSIGLYLNDYTKSVFNKIVNNDSTYYVKDCNHFDITNENLLNCYADIIKYEIIKELKNDGLIIFIDVNNPVFSLYLCNTDLKKQHNLSFLGISVRLDRKNTKEILTNDIETGSLFYVDFNKTKKDYSRRIKQNFLSLLLGYYNLHNILLSINYEQLNIIDDHLSNNEINYKKIESINNRYFLLSRIINNYETSTFSSYSGLQFYDGEKQIKSEVYIEMAYELIKKVKKDFDDLYKDISKIYDIHRIHDDSLNSKRMLIISIITLIVSFIAMVATIISAVATMCQLELSKNNYKSQRINEDIYKQETLSNDNVATISSISESRLVIVEDATLISSTSEIRLNVIR